MAGDEVRRIDSFVYTIASAGCAAVVLFLPLGERWWVPAAFVAELGAAIIWGARVWRSQPHAPRCACCRRRIHDGLQITDIHGPITVHWHGDRPECRAAAEASDRRPRFPYGNGEVSGICSICGMVDPDGLEKCWTRASWSAHRSCVEWLGEPLYERAYDSGGRPANSAPVFAPNVAYVESLLVKLEATYSKPQPPRGRGAGSPTSR